MKPQIQFPLFQIATFLLLTFSSFLIGCKEEINWVERYTTDIVNVHREPSDTSEVITFFEKGTKILVAETEKSEWAKVKLENDQIGYVRKALLSLVEPPKEEPPIDTLTIDTSIVEIPPVDTSKPKPILRDTTKKIQKQDSISYSEEGELPPPLPIKQKQKKPSSLAQFASKRMGTIKTYGTDLQDNSVNLGQLMEWRDDFNLYLGTYTAKLGAPITSIELTSVEENWLKGKLFYQMEQVNDIGLIETKTGEASVRFRITNEGVIVGTEGPIRLIAADFVQWNDQKGILLHLVSQEEPFLLLTKTK